MERPTLVHVILLCLVLIAASGAAFYSQSGKRHLMAAMFFDGMARALEESVSPGMARLADVYETLDLDLDLGPTESILREANEVVVITRCLRAESDVLRAWALGDPEATRQSIDEWYREDLQEAMRRGLYPSGLRRFVDDKRLYLEFIRIRNRYVEPEANRWKLGLSARADGP